MSYLHSMLFWNSIKVWMVELSLKFSKNFDIIVLVEIRKKFDTIGNLFFFNNNLKKYHRVWLTTNLLWQKKYMNFFDKIYDNNFNENLNKTLTYSIE